MVQYRWESETKICFYETERFYQREEPACRLERLQHDFFFLRKGTFFLSEFAFHIRRFLHMEKFCVSGQMTNCIIHFKFLQTVLHFEPLVASFCAITPPCSVYREITSTLRKSSLIKLIATQPYSRAGMLNL